MKKKFLAFTAFTQQMLPLEIDYLLNVQAFEDEERLAILQHMKQVCEPTSTETHFDASIDKRKYSHLKNWVQQRLHAIDVDQQYEWFSRLDYEITTGSLKQQEEQAILKQIQQGGGPIFHFIKWYDLLRNYRQHLLTRMRYQSYEVVMDYLQRQQSRYKKAQQRMEQLHLALIDIVRYYNAGEGEPDKWEDWLNGIFYDTQLDGQSRHLALIRLSILHVAKRNFSKMLALLQQQEMYFLKGEMYSRRILLTYYSNRLILSNRHEQLNDAERFGFLSLRGEHPGSLQYRSNLAAVLLRKGKAREANALLTAAFPQMKQSEQGHDKLNFIGMYLKSLEALNQHEQAIRYADSFLKGTAVITLDHGWHLFFHMYFRALLQQEKELSIIRLAKKYALVQFEENDASHIPFLSWYTVVAKYKENKIGQQKLIALLKESLEKITHIPLEQSFQLLKRELGCQIELELSQLFEHLSVKVKGT